jgi:hypothetical protein
MKMALGDAVGSIPDNVTAPILGSAIPLWTYGATPDYSNLSSFRIRFNGDPWRSRVTVSVSEKGNKTTRAITSSAAFPCVARIDDCLYIPHSAVLGNCTTHVSVNDPNETCHGTGSQYHCRYHVSIIQIIRFVHISTASAHTYCIVVLHDPHQHRQLRALRLPSFDHRPLRHSARVLANMRRVDGQTKFKLRNYDVQDYLHRE